MSGIPTGKIANLHLYKKSLLLNQTELPDPAVVLKV
jgi:hypothetical protein